jgi:large subunit ribosomal protein L1
MIRRGKKYRAMVASYDVKAVYGLDEAVNILKKSQFKFDQTVELHFNLGVDPKHSDQMVRGTVALPHGTGRKVRILAFCKENAVQAAIDAGADFAGGTDLVQKISDGWLDFDAGVATPDMMAVLGKVAKVLGPRGLMPSPKAGTVSPNLAQVIKELKAGKIQYRGDKGANVHAPVGKLSFTGKRVNAGWLT